MGSRRWQPVVATLAVLAWCCQPVAEPASGGVPVVVVAPVPASVTSPIEAPVESVSSKGSWAQSVLETLPGQWAFVHDGEPWLQATIRRDGAELQADVEFVPNRSWTTFQITTIEAVHDSGEQVIIIHGVDDDGSGDSRDVRLHLRSRDRLEGGVTGSSYDRAYEVTARRLRERWEELD